MAHVRFGIDKVPGDKSPSVSEWKLAALTFFDPRFATSAEITDLVNMLDAFSGEYLDIVLHGFVAEEPSYLDPKDVVEVRVGKRKMYYSPKALQIEVDRLQATSSWTFSFEIDVVLVKQRLWYIGDGGYDRDLQTAIVLNVYRMKRDGKLSSYASLFQELISFAKQYDGDDPAWDFSDRKLWRELKKSLFEALKVYLGFRKFNINVEEYAVRDLRKQKT